MKIIVRIENRTFEVEVDDIHSRPILATVEGDTYEVWPEEAAPAVAPQSTAVAGPRLPVPASNGLKSSAVVAAPIPGVIISISVQAGDAVKTGQELCSLEAMKMKSAIRAPRDGKIAAVLVNIGQHVKHHQPLMEYTES